MSRKKSCDSWWIDRQEDGTYLVGARTAEGSVFPTTKYETSRLAAARLLQLLGVGPVAPQSHPESVCIGEVTTEPIHTQECSISFAVDLVTGQGICNCGAIL